MNQKQKTTVIYHSADFDGIFCREIARRFLPEAELIGWNFGDPLIRMPEGQLYILDLSPDCLEQLTVETINQGRLIWIDHHKSSIEKYGKYNPELPGYRIDGVAACRLAWQWFMFRALPDHDGHDLPSNEDFIDRKVFEPLAVRLAGEYDIWDKRDPDAELFQHGLRAQELTEWVWRDLLGEESDCATRVAQLLSRGEVLQYARTKENASVIKEIGFTFQWEGLTWLACNHARYNSLLFTAALRPEHDACFGFKFTGHCASGKSCEQWSISLYHAPGKEHHDLSKIAVKYGGGGHRGACGFQTDKLPFIP